MIVLKINKRFDHQKNKMAVDINSTEVRRFIEYLDTHAIFFDKLSQGDKAKYASYIELIAFGITMTHDKNRHLRAVIAKRSIEMLSELNSELKVSLGVIIQGL